MLRPSYLKQSLKSFCQFEKHINLGLALDQLRQYQEAIEYYHKAILINPKFKHGSIMLGFIYQSISIWAGNKFQKYEEAMECYQKAILINPKDDSAWSKKGVALKFQKKYILIHKFKKQKRIMRFAMAAQQNLQNILIRKQK
ncbi:unnamed protein product [Paramecium pentaurelia]|uniref:Tetratricopeptide repeat protein n=1 Tax=Paramecium pentaurelia TaxID=43138 RepID=A0A8S1WXE6_9CILI|nr:unnamed protein product [Paramecium pentaurelia]